VAADAYTAREEDRWRAGPVMAAAAAVATVAAAAAVAAVASQAVGGAVAALQAGRWPPPPRWRLGRGVSKPPLGLSPPPKARGGRGTGGARRRWSCRRLGTLSVCGGGGRPCGRPYDGRRSRDGGGSGDGRGGGGTLVTTADAGRSVDELRAGAVVAASAVALAVAWAAVVKFVWERVATVRPTARAPPQQMAGGPGGRPCQRRHAGHHCQRGASGGRAAGVGGDRGGGGGEG